MLQGYHGARALYMVMSAAKKAGKEMPKDPTPEALLKYAKENAHLLPKRELELWKRTQGKKR
jgi:hypothetical protein